MSCSYDRMWGVQRAWASNWRPVPCICVDLRLALPGLIISPSAMGGAELELLRSAARRRHGSGSRAAWPDATAGGSGGDGTARGGQCACTQSFGSQRPLMTILKRNAAVTGRASSACLCDANTVFSAPLQGDDNGDDTPASLAHAQMATQQAELFSAQMKARLWSVPRRC